MYSIYINTILVKYENPNQCHESEGQYVQSDNKFKLCGQKYILRVSLKSGPTIKKQQRVFYTKYYKNETYADSKWETG